MSLSKQIEEVISRRNAKIYAEWVGGKLYKQLAHDYGVTESSIKRILIKYRIDNKLPNGRYREDCEK